MRVERLGQDKIRVFLSFDDLLERGIEKEDMWRDIPRVHELFNDMMEQAYDELGFEVSGPIAVEVFALPAQGMVVVVTRGRTKQQVLADEEEELYELEVTLEGSDHLVVVFDDLEPLVQASHRVATLTEPGAGRVYIYEGQYYLVLDNDIGTQSFDDLMAVLYEYGQSTAVTEPVLAEYGTIIFAENGFAKIRHHFAL